jgi:hypothetical protein
MTIIAPGTLLKAKRDLAFKPKKIPAGEVFMFIETEATEISGINEFQRRIFIHWFLNKNGMRAYFVDNFAHIETFIKANERFIEKAKL